MPVHVCGEARDWLQISPFLFLQLFLGQVSHRTNSSLLLDWTIWPPNSSDLPISAHSRPGVTDKCHPISISRKCSGAEVLRFEWQARISPTLDNFHMSLKLLLSISITEFIGSTFSFASETSVSILSASSKHLSLTNLWVILFPVFRRDLDLTWKLHIIKNPWEAQLYPRYRYLTPSSKCTGNVMEAGRVGTGKSIGARGGRRLQGNRISWTEQGSYTCGFRTVWTACTRPTLH